MKSNIFWLLAFIFGVIVGVDDGRPVFIVGASLNAVLATFMLINIIDELADRSHSRKFWRDQRGTNHES